MVAAPIAMYLTVLVALWPIIRQHRDRVRLARNLRARMLIHLMHLIDTFNRRAQPNSREFGTDPLDSNALRKVNELERLFEHGPILNDHETNLIIRVLANLHGASLDRVHPETNRNILALLRELHSELEKDFMRGTLSDPAWGTGET
jgi:hypothetical protein